jgi:hypothetical protein
MLVLEWLLVLMLLVGKKRPSLALGKAEKV